MLRFKRVLHSTQPAPITPGGFKLYQILPHSVSLSKYYFHCLTFPACTVSQLENAGRFESFTMYEIYVSAKNVMKNMLKK